MMKRLQYLWLVPLAIALSFGACKKKEHVNPFDDPAYDPPTAVDTTATYDPNSIQGLYTNVFKPVCANSGCHDGAFEPDFRTVQSSYNSLVFHGIIKNSPDSLYTYRVLPGDADNSILYKRLTIDIDGVSGIMPLTADYDSTSDWFDKKDEYIQNVANWINDGAKDIYGNAAEPGKYKPQISGIVAFSNGSTTPLPRKGGGIKEIKVPDITTQLDIWFSITDVETKQEDLTYLAMKFSTNPFDFSNNPEQALVYQTSPIMEKGYFGDLVEYRYKVTVDPSIYTPGTTFFMRVYVQDEGPVVTEIPTNGSAHYIKEYAAYHIE